MASKFRGSLPTETAFEVATLLCHVAPDLERVLSPGQWAQVLQRFFQGQFDAEFTEKVAHKDPNISVQLFRFLHMRQGKIEVPTPGRVALIQQGCEDNDLTWQAMKLKAEVAKWNAYNEKCVAVAMSHRALQTCQYHRD